MNEDSRKKIENAFNENNPEDIAKEITSMAQSFSEQNKILDARYSYILSAEIFEQLGLYNEAQKNYSVAIANFANDKIFSNTSLTLNAVRCTLSRGDFVTAEILLNTISKEEITENENAKFKLYSAWQWLCKIDKEEDLHEPIVILKSYLELDTMITVKPQILLTLFYITNDSQYSHIIEKIFPNSPEGAIIKNNAKLMPAPFWFFCTRQDSN
ncbi:MAG: hypothetical protein GX220_01030 [Treponema sp.]|nr:hypothetical protein [Treponema sp.]